MHSFYAFIDESGDEGFTFKNPPQRASSEWFVISACVVRANRLAAASRLLKETLDPIEGHRNAPMHFRTLPHEARIPVIHRLANLPIKVICVCFNKKQLGEHALGSDRRLYFYCTRYLVERVSWIARDFSKKGEGDGRCKLTFSHCKRLSYDDLANYFLFLATKQTRIEWEHLDYTNLAVKPHCDSIWLRAADAAASGVFRGLELSEHGFCEDRYARMLKPAVYCRDGNYFSYGMKVFPTVPRLEPGRDGRYGWLNLYKNGGATRNEDPSS